MGQGLRAGTCTKGWELGSWGEKAFFQNDPSMRMWGKHMRTEPSDRALGSWGRYLGYLLCPGEPTSGISVLSPPLPLPLLQSGMLPEGLMEGRV